MSNCKTGNWVQVKYDLSKQNLDEIYKEFLEDRIVNCQSRLKNTNHKS